MEKWLETEVGSAVVVVVDGWEELERFWQAVRRTEGKATTFWRRLEKVPFEYWLRTKDLRWESVKVWEDKGRKGIEQGWLRPVIVLRVLSIGIGRSKLCDYYFNFETLSSSIFLPSL